MKFADNFISEKNEKILLDLVKCNNSLMVFDLAGNRISMSILNRIKKKMNENEKRNGFKEPNRLRNKVFRLRYEEKKVKRDKELIQMYENKILNVEGELKSLDIDLERFYKDQENQRNNINKKIVDQEKIIEKKKVILEAKKSEYNAIVREHEKTLGFKKDETESILLFVYFRGQRTKR